MKQKKKTSKKKQLRSPPKLNSQLPNNRRLPKQGDRVKATFVRFTSKNDVIFRLETEDTGIMDKSYLMWFQRPSFKCQNVKILFTKSAPPFDLEVKVGERTKTGKTTIRLGHFYTREHPWSDAKKQHPMRSRLKCTVKDFVGQYAIVEFKSGFWGWLPNSELSWTESKEAIDLFVRGTDVIEVVVIDHLEPKHRIIVSYREGLPKSEETKPEILEPKGKPTLPQDEADEELSTLCLEEDNKSGSDGVDEAFEEGGVIFQLHRRKERNPKAVQRKRETVLARKGKLTCEACDFDFIDVYGALGTGFAECHHRTPLATLVKAHRTRLSELAILCANCHRMIHRSSPMLSVEELRQLIESVSADANYE